MDSLDFRSASFSKTSKALYALATRLFPICRSITGEGFRASLEILKKEFENGGGGGKPISNSRPSLWHRSF
ncbi:protein containing aminopeptidase domain [Campylobacter upsaliensis RM3195]|nr:protein containing aminopeptidase domain [Campylobacter upsaliensis RM3195]